MTGVAAANAAGAVVIGIAEPHRAAELDAHAVVAGLDAIVVHVEKRITLEFAPVRLTTRGALV